MKSKAEYELDYLKVFDSNSNSRVSITEVKAATDESVRLLNEMQDKAKLNIIRTVKVDENNLKGCAIYYRDDMMDYRYSVQAKFNLNGKDYFVEFIVRKDDFIQETNSKITDTNYSAREVIANNLAKLITNELLK